MTSNKISQEIATDDLHSVVHRYVDKYDRQEIKPIGLFSSRELAEAAVRELIGQPGFRDHPDDFQISKVTLDKILWEDGF